MPLHPPYARHACPRLAPLGQCAAGSMPMLSCSCPFPCPSPCQPTPASAVAPSRMPVPPAGPPVMTAPRSTSSDASTKISVSSSALMRLTAVDCSRLARALMRLTAVDCSRLANRGGWHATRHWRMHQRHCQEASCHQRWLSSPLWCLLCLLWCRCGESLRRVPASLAAACPPRPAALDPGELQQWRGKGRGRGESSGKSRGSCFRPLQLLTGRLGALMAACRL